MTPRATRVNAALLRSTLAALPDEVEFVNIAIGDYRKPLMLWTNGQNRPAMGVVMPVNPQDHTTKTDFDFDADYRTVRAQVFAPALASGAPDGWSAIEAGSEVSK